MLKKISKLFLGLVVCAGSACVTPTHASSAENILMSRIQAAGEYGAKDEYVVLHNNSGIEVDISGWCLVNKSNISFACLVPARTDVTEHYFVPPYGEVVIVSNDHAVNNSQPATSYTYIYEVTNQSSGSMVGSNDTVSVINVDNEIVDTKGWVSAAPTGKILARMLVMAGPDIYADTGAASDWTTKNREALPLSSVELRVIADHNPDPDPDPDPDPNPDPQEEPPTNTYQPLPPMLTEIFANPAGTDTGNEFIELYNPNEQDTISLDSYTLVIGVDSPKSYSFPIGATIPAKSYIAFSNQQIDYTLVNTTGRVQLAKNGVTIGEAVDYTSPKDDYVWALIDDVWQYTKQATPGAPNSLVAETTSEEDTSATSTSKPCAVNQFRNPATGRCKLISAASSSPTPCKENQERNLETNRCRNIVATSSATPCKEGQERNPETNRCRNIVKMSTAGNSVSAQSKNDAAMSWYYWAAIGAIVLLVLGYAIWEWRQELANLWVRTRAAFAKHGD
ncbi:MAG: lamin tail domain-containing protein [Candidatus Saccharimonadaceae bacterium]